MQETLEQQLICAAMQGQVTIVRALLQQDSINVNKRDRHGCTALRYAASNGHEDVVISLLKHNNTDVNKMDRHGCTALMRAVIGGVRRTGGHTEVVKQLLQQDGINVEIRCYGNWTALMYAVSEGYVDIVELLLQDHIKKGVNYNAYCVLELAVRKADMSIVEVLIQNDIEINTRNNTQQTVLMFVAQKGRQDISRWLVKKGADINAKDEKGLTAKDHLQRRDYLQRLKSFRRGEKTTYDIMLFTVFIDIALIMVGFFIGIAGGGFGLVSFILFIAAGAAMLGAAIYFVHRHIAITQHVTSFFKSLSDDRVDPITNIVQHKHKLDIPSDITELICDFASPSFTPM